MKELNDQAIQELLEKRTASSNAEINSTDDNDFKTYQLLFEALEKKPAMKLSDDFSAKVIDMLQAKKARAYDLKLYFTLAVILIAFLAGSYFYLIGMNTESSSNSIVALLKFKWILLFGVAMFSVFQFLDQKLVTHA